MTLAYTGGSDMSITDNPFQTVFVIKITTEPWILLILAIGFWQLDSYKIVMSN